MTEIPRRPRAILPSGTYLIRLHLDGETASIALLDAPDTPIWVGGWAAAAIVVQDFDGVDRPEPLTWDVRVS